MNEPLHCRECDDISCPGFATPRATPEPLPLPQGPGSTEAARRAAIEAAAEAVRLMKGKVEGR